VPQINLKLLTIRYEWSSRKFWPSFENYQENKKNAKSVIFCLLVARKNTKVQVWQFAKTKSPQKMISCLT
jgi:hypothetical protein